MFAQICLSENLRTLRVLRFLWYASRQRLHSIIHQQKFRYVTKPMEQTGRHVVHLVYHSSTQQRTWVIHQELKGSGEDLYQNDREMWFSLNYRRVILSKEGMMRMAPPEFLFKVRIQSSKCLHKTLCIQKSVPKWTTSWKNMLYISLISAFVVRCLDSIMSIPTKYTVSRL